MKNLLFIGTLTFLTACGMQEEKGNFSIAGHLDNPVEQEFYLQEWVGNTYRDIDTGMVSQDGNLSLRADLKDTSYYRIDFGLERFVYIIGGPGESLTINADLNNVEGTYSISGSQESVQLQEYLMHKYRYIAYEDSLKQILNIHKNNNDWGSYGIALMDKRSVEQSYYDSIRSFIAYHPESYASRIALTDLNPEEDLDLYEKVAKALSAKAKSNDPYVAELNQKIKEYKALSIGEVAPVLSFPSPDGSIASTKDLRGKYVLIDFWASWCKPCRQENPNLVALYNDYKDENFEIYGYSLDQNKVAWESAINSDKLPWIHASDLRGWQAEGAATFKVYSIPMSYLLDPEGRIIAKGLRGEELTAKLAEIFEYGIQ